MTTDARRMGKSELFSHFAERGEKIDDLVVHTLARVLDRLGLPHTLAPEWQGGAPRVSPPQA